MAKTNQNNKGIGLLELMLSLAVLSIMLVVAVRYYSSANSAQEASTLVNSYGTIKAAVENYLADNASNTTIPTMGDLVSGGYLPSAYGIRSGKTFVAAPNPWGGQVTVSPASSNSMFAIMQTNIPLSVCQQAVGQLQSTINLSLGESAIALPSSKSKPAGGSSGSIGTVTTTCGLSSSITVIYVA